MSNKPRFVGEKVRLGEVVSASSERNKGERCSAVYSVTNSQGFIPSEEYFSKEVYSKDLKTYRVVRRNMIAYNPSRINVGSVALQNKCDEVVVSPLYVVFSVDENRVMPDYLVRFLKSKPGLNQIAFQSIGTVRNNLKFKAMCQMKLTLPSLNVQRGRLANLALIETQLNQSRKAIEGLDSLVKSRFVEMFGKEENLVKLSDVCETFNGDRGSNYPSADERIDSGVPFINAGNLIDGMVSFEKMEYISKEKYDQLSGGKIKAGDLLYCLRGSLGKCALAEFDEGTIASSLMIIRCKQLCIDSKYLYEVMNSPFVKKQMAAANNGSSQPNLSAKSVKQFEIPLPSLDCQQEFAAFVRQVDKSRFVAQQQIEKLQTLYDSLAQEYFGD